jgi:HSP20 family molecular chaperone IbpA
MANLTINKVNEPEKARVPIFEEIAKRFEEVRRRAFNLFEKRGCELGHEVEDWFTAEHEIMGWPAAEFAEKHGGYELQITLPGFEAKDVEVTTTPNEIVVHAATKHEKKTEEGKVLWTEFGSNDVYRRFETPNPIDVDKATATLDKGLLKITAPKAAAVGLKAVAVKAA